MVVLPFGVINNSNNISFLFYFRSFSCVIKVDPARRCKLVSFCLLLLTRNLYLQLHCNYYSNTFSFCLTRLFSGADSTKLFTRWMSFLSHHQTTPGKPL